MEKGLEMAKSTIEQVISQLATMVDESERIT